MHRRLSISVHLSGFINFLNAAGKEYQVFRRKGVEEGFCLYMVMGTRVALCPCFLC